MPLTHSFSDSRILACPEEYDGHSSQIQKTTGVGPSFLAQEPLARAQLMLPKSSTHKQILPTTVPCAGKKRRDAHIRALPSIIIELKLSSLGFSLCL